MESYCAALGFAWSCPLACLGRADTADQVAVRSIQKIDATSVVTGDTMPTTATVLTNEDDEADPGLNLAPGQEVVATVHDLEAGAITENLHLIQSAGAGLAPRLAQSQRLLFGVALGPALDLGQRPALAPDPGPALAALRGSGNFRVSDHMFAFLHLS